MEFLPINKQDLKARNIDFLDFIVVTGDAYVDHPSFGHAIISRLVEAEGYDVGLLAQPVTDSDYTSLGEPTKAFLVASGVVDSMVNNYSVSGTLRDKDVYSEGGKPGRRPDRALIVYCKNLRRLYPNTPIIIGGIEASLRRLSHYDYWSDSVMNSILVDTGADLLIYGMGENPIFELMKAARRNIPLDKIKNIRGTAYLVDESNATKEVLAAIGGDTDKYEVLSSHERVSTNKVSYAKAFMAGYNNTDPFTARPLIQKQSNTTYCVVNVPALPLTEKQMDYVYAIDYVRKPHPRYALGVPAIEEVEFSVTAHRGCYGNCSFCALTYHQGKIIQSRSDESILTEVENMTKSPDFKGYVHDIGGPSANFHTPSCDKQMTQGTCPNRECIGYKPCPNLKVTHAKYMGVLRQARKIPGVKKVFVRSGIRFDYLMMDNDKSVIEELVEHHISGQLKVAPEHSCESVLEVMNKPTFKRYLEFYNTYAKANKKLALNQFLVPYFISSHPGCTVADACSLTDYLIEIHYMPRQVQDFYPTPSTLSTTMYYTELDPRTMQPIYVAKTHEDKAMQRALLQYRLKVNQNLIKRACIKAERPDLLAKIGISADTTRLSTPSVNGGTRPTATPNAPKAGLGLKPNQNVKSKQPIKSPTSDRAATSVQNGRINPRNASSTAANSRFAEDTKSSSDTKYSAATKPTPSSKFKPKPAPDEPFSGTSTRPVSKNSRPRFQKKGR